MAPAITAMTEEITISLQDMQTFLEPEDYQKFIRLKEEVEGYLKRNLDHEIKKLNAEWARDECQKRRDEAKTDAERFSWDSERFNFMMEALMPAPYYPAHYFYEHDRYIELVRQRKMKQIEEEQRKEAEEEAERQRQKERRQREKQMMLATMKRKTLADSEWEEFQLSFNSAIKELKHQLANPKPPKLALECSPEVFKYCPQSWCDLELPGDEEVEVWAKPQVLEKVPEVLRPFVIWALTPQVLVVPQVEYEVGGVSCVSWHFDVYVSAKVDLWLKESTITKDFNGLKYMAPIRARKIGSFFLGPQYWDCEKGFSTPIRLLRLLVEGELEGPGIEVLIHDASHTVYMVEGFDDYFVDVTKEFCKFISETAEDQSLAQALLGQGLLDEEGAKLLEGKWDEPLPVTSKPTHAEPSELESVVLKLVELGWTEADAKKEVETTTFPKNATAEQIVKIILEKSY